MTISVAVIDELARAYGEVIPEHVREALVRIEASVTRDVTEASPAVTAKPVRSKGADRTARWRERRRAAASHVTSQGVTEASPSVTPVTPPQQKEVPPTPPLRKTSLPQKGVSGRKRRHPVTSPPPEPVRSQVFLDEHDARFRELGAMRGRPYPNHNGGWWFEPFLVAQAEERLAAKVAVLRPSALAVAAATGPPRSAKAG